MWSVFVEVEENILLVLLFVSFLVATKTKRGVVVSASLYCLFLISNLTQELRYTSELAPLIYLPFTVFMASITCFLILQYSEKIRLFEISVLITLLGVMALALARYIDAWYLPNFKMGSTYTAIMMLLDTILVGLSFYPNTRKLLNKLSDRLKNAAFRFVFALRGFFGDGLRGYKGNK